MSTNNSNIINGYDLVQAKSALPQFIQCSTRYKELSQLFSQTEYQETLLDIITTTIKRIRRYQSSKVIDLARLVKLLYGIQKPDSIQIKYNGKTQFDFPYGETTRLLFDTFNKELATIYPPEKMMQFYKFLYAELLWNEEIKSPIDNNDTKILLFEYNASKNYKRIVAFEKEDDIDIRLYFGYKFKDGVTPYYAKNEHGKTVQPIGFTLKGVKTILAIESTLQKRIDSHYVGTLLYTLGTEFQFAGIFKRGDFLFTNEQYAFLYDIAGILGVLDKDFNIEYSNKEKQTFVRKEMKKYNKYIIK